VVDWATSTMAMGRVQQLKREGGTLPPNSAVDSTGMTTTDPHAVSALLPFGQHKGYGLALINELYSAIIGGSLPTLRCRSIPEGEKRTPSFYFQVIHPEALSSGNYACGRDLAHNLAAVIQDVLGHGNEDCLLPGQVEAQAAKQTEAAGGLLFSEAEIEEFNVHAAVCGAEPFDLKTLKQYNPA